MTSNRALVTLLAALLLIGDAAMPSGRALPRAAATAQAQAPLASPLGAESVFTVACATSTLEAAPVYLTAEGPFGRRMQYINGGVRTLANSGAHAATNATTQLLVTIQDNPKVRLLFTLAEGLYRIVGRRSAGIARLADLKGKRVVVPREHVRALLPGGDAAIGRTQRIGRHDRDRPG